MARPPASELTTRELEIMHVFWKRGSSTVGEVRDAMAEAGLDLAYTTVATLVRIIADKGFLRQINDDRPFRFEPARTFEEVSGRLIDDVVERVFRGSRDQLLFRLIDERGLSPKERAMLEVILREDEQEGQTDE